MGLVTRCPACKTLFHLEPDQLTSSGGWARCGVCGEDFDSALQRYQVVKPEPAQVSSSSVTEISSVSLADTPAHREAQPVAQVSGTANGESVDLLVDEIPSRSFADHLVEAEQALDTVREPGFLSAGASSETPRKRSTPFSLALSLLFVITLMAQVTLHERGRIAAQWPAFQTLLEEVCGFSFCRLTPSRDVVALMIDSSSLLNAADGAYLLKVTVRNQSAASLVLPSIELVLTDSLEQLVIRKVLTPAELGAKNEILTPLGQWSGTATLRIELPPGAETFTGYRVLAFYP